MPKESHWRIASRRKLAQIYAATPRQPDESPEQYGKRLRRAIAQNYPFSQRSGFAYKCWLSERGRFLYGLGLSAPPKKPQSKSKRAVVERAALESQLSFW